MKNKYCINDKVDIVSFDCALWNCWCNTIESFTYFYSVLLSVITQQKGNQYRNLYLLIWKFCAHIFNSEFNFFPLSFSWMFLIFHGPPCLFKSFFYDAFNSLNFICLMLFNEYMYALDLFVLFAVWAELSLSGIIPGPVDSVAISQLATLYNTKTILLSYIYIRLNLKVLFEFILIYIFVYQISQANIILDPVDTVAISQHATI